MLKNNKNIFFLLVFLFCLGFFVRSLIFIPATFVDRKTIFCDTDPYYHMRRIVNYLTTGHFIQFDYYLDYPRGAVSFWPSGFEKLVAYFVWVLSAGHPSPEYIEKVAAWFPPLFGAFTVVLVYFLFALLFGRAVGLLAAALFIFQPTHIDYSRLGKVDHHVMEVFSAVLLYLGGLFTNRQLLEKELSGKTYLSAIFVGLAIAFSYLMWSGATLYLVPWLVAVYFSVYFISQEKLPDYLRIQLIIFASAILLLLYPVLTSYWTKNGRISFEALSLFQIIFLLIPLLFFGGYLALIKSKKFSSVVSGRLYAAYSLGVLLVSFIFLRLLLPSVFANFRSGLALLAKRGIGHYYAWLTTISEYTPMLLVNNQIVWLRAVASLNWAVVFLVPAIVLYLVELIRRREEMTSAIFLGCLTLFFTFLSLQQLRYGYIAAVFVSGWAAYFWIKLWRLAGRLNWPFLQNFSRRVHNFLFQHLPYNVLPEINLRNLTWLVIFYFLLKNYSLYQRIFLANPPGPMLSPMDYETLQWLRDNTPDPGFYDNPLNRPAYGVMNIWDWGHFIEYIARRPAAVNPYGMGVEKMVRFYLARSEEEANKVMEENNCRYVLTSDPLPIIEGLRKVSLLYPGQDFQVLQTEGPYLKIPKKEFLNLMGIKLHLHDGSRPYVPDMEVEGLKHWRLVYESPEMSELTYLGGPQQTAKLKIFEYVAGAVYRGKTRPGQEISVQTELVTNTGRHFVYLNKYVSDSAGHYEIILPYSGDCPYPVKMSAGYYTIEIGRTKKKISVREEEVKNGKIILAS